MLLKTNPEYKVNYSNFWDDRIDNTIRSNVLFYTLYNNILTNSNYFSKYIEENFTTVLNGCFF